jgi:hypothetical protein
MEKVRIRRVLPEWTSGEEEYFAKRLETSSLRQLSIESGLNRETLRLRLIKYFASRGLERPVASAGRPSFNELY